MWCLWLFVLIYLQCLLYVKGKNAMYKGKFLGSFPPGSGHLVKGNVYAVNERTLYIEGFSFDGNAPASHFWTGTTPEPGPKGIKILDTLGRDLKLIAYNNQNLILRMPGDLKIKDVKWIAIWCQVFQINFGHVVIPLDFKPPQSVDLGRLPTLAHGVSASSVIAKNVKTIEIKNLHYDGAAPAAFFMVGKGDKPHQGGTKIPDENGSLNNIHKYTGQDITLRLPGNLTLLDVDWFGIYCIKYSQNFGNVNIPESIESGLPADLQQLARTVNAFLNCETIFNDLMQVSWEVRGSEIYFQLEGKVRNDQYLSFGLSGSPQQPKMIGADVAVAFYDSKSSRVIVNDYTLTQKAQCSPSLNSGVCPDNKVDGNENVKLVASSYFDGIMNVVYKRLLDTDDQTDQVIKPETLQTIVAAIGPMNKLGEAAYHNIKWTRGTDDPIRIEFSRKQQSRNCKAFEIEDSRPATLKLTELLKPKTVSSSTQTEHASNSDKGQSSVVAGYNAITRLFNLTSPQNNRILLLLIN